MNQTIELWNINENETGDGFTLTSDAWEDVNGESLVNFVATSTSGESLPLKEFRAAKKKKTGRYVAALTLKVVNEFFPCPLKNLFLLLFVTQQVTCKVHLNCWNVGFQKCPVLVATLTS